MTKTTQEKAPAPRTFKTKWFAKAAKKEGVTDAQLCVAIDQVRSGQADNLGGGVFKKRLGKNLYRSIVLAKGGNYWVYVFLFAKKDQGNIANEELEAFKKLADIYSRKSNEEIKREIGNKELVEICI